MRRSIQKGKKNNNIDSKSGSNSSSSSNNNNITMYWINFLVLFPLGRLIIARVNGMCWHGCWPFGIATKPNAHTVKCQVHTTLPLPCWWICIYCIVYARLCAILFNLPFINEIYKFHFPEKKNIISSHVRRFMALDSFAWMCVYLQFDPIFRF